jgi:hypothetical protein
MTRRLLLASLALTLACASTPRQSNDFEARWTNPAAETKSVRLSWHATDGPNRGTLSTRLGGKRFSGYFAVIHEEGAPIITSVYRRWDNPAYTAHDWGAGFDGFEPVDYATFVRVYSGRVLATLASKRGTAMRCNLEPTSVESGPLAHARGRCQISDGGRLDIDF